MTPATTILWFKRDLRVHDHTALNAAYALQQPILPLFVIEPDFWQLPDSSRRQFDFVVECLADLRIDLRQLGAHLNVCVGSAVEVLETLRKAHHVTHLVSHEETGNAWTYARDRDVAAWARGQGVAWTELPQAGVIRRLPDRNGWSAARDRRIAQAVMQPPPTLSGLSDCAQHDVPGAADLGLEDDHCTKRQRGGRVAAEECLTSFLKHRGQSYRRQMSSPLKGADACSRLSPHLAWGTLSGREVAHAAAVRKAEARAHGGRDGWVGSISSFQARLAWRDHFMQKLEDEPALENRCLHPDYEGLRPDQPDPALVSAWQKGETGIPFVDACMRSLIATGWLNFRMRSMLMAVASYHLWLDWRPTGTHLARLFTDFEPGIHWPQVQMQSGTTGMNTVRIYNPVKQGHDQDPNGVFTRRWCPELAPVPDAYLQEPWRWQGAGTVLDVIYPAPCVDLKVAAQQARERVWAIRKGAAFREEAAKIVQKHASRKSSTRRRKTVRKAADAPRQLSLDL